jgi:hypothetical protein
MISQHPPYDCTASTLAMREIVNIKLLTQNRPKTLIAYLKTYIVEC